MSREMQLGRRSLAGSLAFSETGQVDQNSGTAAVDTEQDRVLNLQIDRPLK